MEAFKHKFSFWGSYRATQTSAGPSPQLWNTVHAPEPRPAFLGLGEAKVLTQTFHSGEIQIGARPGLWGMDVGPGSEVTFL